MEVGEEAGDFGGVDLVGSEGGEFAVDLGQATFSGADSFLEVGELRNSLGGARQTGSGLQVGVVGSELVLQGGAFLGQVGDADLGLKSDLADGFGDQLGIGADLVDLVDYEPFDLASGHRGGRALVPAAFLGGAAEVVAVAAVAFAGVRVGHRALAAAAAEQTFR